MLKFMISLRKNWHMVLTWSRYEIQASYIDTKLGVLWIVIQPIFQTLIYTFAFSALLLRPPKEGVPFILFFLGGITAWSFMNNNWMQSGHMIVKHIDLLDQVKVEAETIVVVKLVESLIEFVLNFLIFVVISAVLGYYPNPTYFFLPIIFSFLLLTTLGGMYFFSSLGVFVRDIPNVIGMALRLLFFVSGVLITPDMIPENYRGILNINPLLHLIESVRSIIIYAEPPSMISFVYMGSFSVLAFLIGLTHFQKRKGVFVDYK